VSEVSKAAEKYTSQKVEEIMATMGSRSNATKGWHSQNTTSGGSPGNVDGSKSASKVTSSHSAAQDLAATRVQAMMAALTHPESEEESEI